MLGVWSTHLGGWGHFVNGVTTVGRVDGARDNGAVMRQVIQRHHALLLIQCSHYRICYAPLVETCENALVMISTSQAVTLAA